MGGLAGAKLASILVNRHLMLWIIHSGNFANHSPLVNITIRFGLRLA
jgi:hypothetical protein